MGEILPPVLPLVPAPSNVPHSLSHAHFQAVNGTCPTSPCSSLSSPISSQLPAIERLLSFEVRATTLKFHNSWPSTPPLHTSFSSVKAPERSSSHLAWREDKATRTQHLQSMQPLVPTALTFCLTPRVPLKNGEQLKTNTRLPDNRRKMDGKMAALGKAIESRAVCAWGPPVEVCSNKRHSFFERRIGTSRTTAKSRGHELIICKDSH